MSKKILNEIKKVFEIRLNKNSNYSLRAFAKSLDIDHQSQIESPQAFDTQIP